MTTKATKPEKQRPCRLCGTTEPHPYMVDAGACSGICRVYVP